jgi:hypothetical protein
MVNELGSMLRLQRLAKRDRCIQCLLGISIWCVYTIEKGLKLL